MDKLADRLDELKVSDRSEQNEDEWGSENSFLDLKGYNSDDVNSQNLPKSEMSQYYYQSPIS